MLLISQCIPAPAYGHVKNVWKYTDPCFIIMIVCFLVSYSHLYSPHAPFFSQRLSLGRYCSKEGSLGNLINYK